MIVAIKPNASGASNLARMILRIKRRRFSAKLPMVNTPPPWSILPRKLSDLKSVLNLFNNVVSSIFIPDEFVSPKSFYLLKYVSFLCQS
jgi:hypothetical protein